MDTFHLLLSALPSLALDTSSDPGAASGFLGTLCQILLTLTGKKILSNTPSNPSLCQFESIPLCPVKLSWEFGVRARHFQQGMGQAAPECGCVWPSRAELCQVLQSMQTAGRGQTRLENKLAFNPGHY